MAIRPLTWHPAQCDCIIDVVYDDAALPQPAVPYTPVAIQRKCAFHASLTTPQAVFEALVQESQGHEWARDAVLQALPSLGRTVLNTDGSTSVDFRSDITVTWGPIVGKGRTLTISIPNLPPAQRTAAQAAIDARIGAGKVQVG